MRNGPTVTLGSSTDLPVPNIMAAFRANNGSSRSDAVRHHRLRRTDAQERRRDLSPLDGRLVHLALEERVHAERRDRLGRE